MEDYGEAFGNCVRARARLEVVGMERELSR